MKNEKKNDYLYLFPYKREEGRGEVCTIKTFICPFVLWYISKLLCLSLFAYFLTNSFFSNWSANTKILNSFVLCNSLFKTFLIISGWASVVHLQPYIDYDIRNNFSFPLEDFIYPTSFSLANSQNNTMFCSFL